MRTASNLHDASGAPVRPDQRPPDVTELPFWDDCPALPDGFEARLLDGNWYGSGPVVVIFHPASQVHVDFPLNSPDWGVPLAISVIRAKMREVQQ